MCATCGCGTDAVHDDSHDHDHAHHHDHDHDHGHAAPVDGNLIKLERAVLEANARLAERNRGWFAGRGVTALNLMSSPGAGKTTLLERTLTDLGGQLDIRVIEGDQATDRDAERIRAAGGRAIQINTGTGCHLDAKMIERVLPELDAPRGGLVFIENVGNLVCPALFDLGERAKVLVASVTEGDDKPLKYPHMFHACELIILNKLDLLPYVTFDVEKFAANVRRVTHGSPVLHVSATRGDGLDAWYSYLRRTP
ncbi:MAG: hydrogenase nickel incorporation protein HypB [Deltaproteobacteria bacterium]|nr:hydrogenase nickel incorporation protein HypB [Deltaproteobacteria bacterium]